jgi:hypothetical protein
MVKYKNEARMTGKQVRKPTAEVNSESDNGKIFRTYYRRNEQEDMAMCVLARLDRVAQNSP